MLVTEICNLDYRKCAPCQDEMDTLIYAIYVNSGLNTAIRAAGYAINPTYYGYIVRLSCGGVCEIADNNLSKTADIISWDC